MTAPQQTQSSQIAVTFRPPHLESREMVAKLFWIGMDDEAVTLAQTMKHAVIDRPRDTD